MRQQYKNINKQIKFLGVETADPIEYTHLHSTELIDSHKLPQLVNEYKTPQEEVLASNLTQSEFILTGDLGELILLNIFTFRFFLNNLIYLNFLDALKLVNRDELNKYLLTKF